MIYAYLPQLLAGLIVTIELAICALIFGILFGFLMALCKLSNIHAFKWSANFVTSIFRGLPELMVIFLIYFGGTILLTKIFGEYINVNTFIAGVIALGFIFASYFCEVLISAFNAISTGQLVAADTHGFSYWQKWRYILLPQLWHYAYPGFGNLCLVLIKDTAIVSLIGLTDLMQATNNAQAATAMPLEFYLIAAGLYLIITTFVLLLLKLLAHKMRLNTWIG